MVLTRPAMPTVGLITHPIYRFNLLFVGNGFALAHIGESSTFLLVSDAW